MKATPLRKYAIVVAGIAVASYLVGRFIARAATAAGHEVVVVTSVYDKSDLPGFYMAIGTSGNQFKNAAPAGYLMAEIIDACERGHYHDSDPVQVKCRYIPHMLDGKFYSRLREINEESSFSVLG